MMAYQLHLLARYGEKSKRIPIIIILALSILGWLIWSIYQKRKHTEKTKREKSLFNKIYLTFAVVTLLAITGLTGKSLYESAQPWQGKLAFYVERYKNEKTFTFTDENIYKDDLDGIFNPLDKKFDLPDDLYLATDFLINFNREGTITAFDGQFYGKDKTGDTQSYVITYNNEKSDEMTVYLNQEVDATYSEDKKLSPLFEILTRISLEEAASIYGEADYRLTYEGIVSRFSLHKDIFWIKEDGTMILTEPTASGYTLTLHGQTRENYEDILANYVYAVAKTLTDEEIREKEVAEKETRTEPEKPKEWEVGYNNHEGIESYFMNEAEGYELAIADAALGSRYYYLRRTIDGGETWEEYNPDPFLGEAGGSAGIIFINESLGFIALAKQAGTRAILYRTTDGGKSYEKVSFPSVEVPLTDQETYDPFTFPGMPYKEDGKLYVSIGQGADGDYNGGVSALFVSEDDGKTWEFVEEEPLENEYIE